MNPWRLLTIYRRASTLVGYFEEAAVSKSLFTSKLFWFNVLSAGSSLLGVLPLPPEHVATAVAIINIALRYVTSTPVHVVSPK